MFFFSYIMYVTLESEKSFHSINSNFLNYKYHVTLHTNREFYSCFVAVVYINLNQTMIKMYKEIIWSLIIKFKKNDLCIKHANKGTKTFRNFSRALIDIVLFDTKINLF